QIGFEAKPAFACQFLQRSGLSNILRLLLGGSPVVLEIFRHVAGLPLIPRVKTAMRMFRRGDVRARVKDGKSGWVVIEQGEGAANRAARQQVARFILLEGARAAANQFARNLLG